MRKDKSQYLKIKNDLKKKIDAGVFKKNTTIPTELELSTIYGVSRTTIRKATELLVFEGLLSRRAGIGTFVTPKAILSKSVKHYGFKQEMILQKYEVKTVVSNFSAEAASDEIAEILGIVPGEMVYYFERTRLANNVPLQFEKTYMSIQKYPDINIAYLENSKYNYVENIKKQKIDFCVHTINPILSTKELSRVFNIKENTPILQIYNITYLNDGSVMDYTIQYNNPEKYQMKYIRKKEEV